EVARRLHEVRAVDVGHEAQREPPVRVPAQRLGGHGGPEVGAADPEVDDVADGAPGEARPRPAAHAAGEVRHAIEHGMDARHDVLAVHDDARAAGGAQRDVQDGPTLGDVELLAGEHRLDARAQAGGSGQVEQQ